MGILDRKKVINLAVFYHLYESYLESSFAEKQAYGVIAKTKTSIIRFVLPEWGFPLKTEGNLAPCETIEGLKFMEQISIYQAVHALEVQERVFEKFGDRASPASRRVYRSALRKMMNWGRSQDWWKQSVEISPDGRAPSMLVFKKRVEHWHKLKPQEIPPSLSQQLDSFSIYLATLRHPCLNESSCIRFRREVLGVFGWMHRVKGIALVDLSLTELVPFASIYDTSAAERVAAQAEEYIEWMRSNLGGKESTLKFALKAFFLVAEYIHYEHTKTD